jgi:hypothetical protein
MRAGGSFIGSGGLFGTISGSYLHDGGQLEHGVDGDIGDSWNGDAFLGILPQF